MASETNGASAKSGHRVNVSATSAKIGAVAQKDYDDTDIARGMRDACMPPHFIYARQSGRERWAVPRTSSNFLPTPTALYVKNSVGGPGVNLDNYVSICFIW